VSGGYSSLPASTIVVPDASCEVALSSITIARVEITVVAAFAVGRSTASRIQQLVYMGRPPSAQYAFSALRTYWCPERFGASGAVVTR
jgi:hypothetical protein